MEIFILYHPRTFQQDSFSRVSGESLEDCQSKAEDLTKGLYRQLCTKEEFLKLKHEYGLKWEIPPQPEERF